MSIKIKSFLIALIVFSMSFCLPGCNSKKTNDKETGSTIIDNTNTGSNTTIDADDSLSDNESDDSLNENTDNNSTLINKEKIWNSQGNKRPTVFNMKDYTFDEDKYYGVSMGGGKYTRSKNFVRGMGYSLWSKEDGWNPSNKTAAIDEENFKELNITSFRTWHDSFEEDAANLLSRGYTTAPTVNLSILNGESLAPTKFKDGNVFTGNGYSFINPLSLDVFKRGISVLEKIKNLSGYEVYLLGNEYTLTNPNPVYNHYQPGGYDDYNLEVFRNNWLKKRFNTIKNFNDKCNTSYKSFNQVDPDVNYIVRLEFWLFLRNGFSDFIKTGYTQFKKSVPGMTVGYAKLMGRDNPTCDDAYLSFLDSGTQNLYYHWFDDFSRFSLQLDQLVASSKGKPVYITETGFMNGFTDESKKLAARNYKQLLSLYYMRPQLQGAYIFTYSGANENALSNTDLEATWGLTEATSARTKKPSYYAVKQVYGDFKYLDNFFTGASSSNLVTITNQLFDDLINNSTYSNRSASKITEVLYANGVTVDVALMDEAKNISNIDTNKMILMDSVLYQNPDGSNDVSAALANYINTGGQIISYTSDVCKPLYGIGSSFTAKTKELLQDKYKNGLKFSSNDLSWNTVIWNELAPFIHGDFIQGKVKATKNTINESVIRILDSDTGKSVNADDAKWDVQQQLVFKDGNVYLCIVNTSEKIIDRLDITIGVSASAKMNFHPEVLRADGNVSVSKPSRANVPSWIGNMNSTVSYGTLSINNLDTYAFINLGKAIVE